MTNCGVAWLSGNKDLTFMMVQQEDCHILLLLLQIKSHKKKLTTWMFTISYLIREILLLATQITISDLSFCFLFFYHFFLLNVDETV